VLQCVALISTTIINHMSVSMYNKVVFLSKVLRKMVS